MVGGTFGCRQPPLNLNGRNLNLRRTLVPKWGYKLLWKESERRRRKLEVTVKALLELVEDEKEPS